MKKSVTLLEIVIVIAISSILIVGTFKALNVIFLRSKSAQILTELSLETQSVIDILSALLYDRVPMSAIIYDSQSSYENINTADLETMKVLEWVGISKEVMDNNCSAYVNIKNMGNYYFYSPLTDGSGIENIVREKFNTSDKVYGKNGMLNLIFAGSFDMGGINVGWYGTDSSDAYDINITGEKVSIADDKKPDEIYERYYLVDSAYAVTVGKYVDKNATCIEDLKNSGVKITDYTLLIFYDFRPWKKETYCADKYSGSIDKKGKVSVLMQDVTSFEAEKLGAINIRIKIQADREVNGGNKIRITKQKVIF